MTNLRCYEIQFSKNLVWTYKIMEIFKRCFVSLMNFHSDKGYKTNQ